MSAHEHILVAKRFANDVGSCQACSYPMGATTSGNYPADAIVYVIGMWPTKQNGHQFRLCSICCTELGFKMDDAKFTQATHTSSLAASKLQGVIARKAKTKTTKALPAPARRAHVAAKPKRKPRKYAAKAKAD